MSAWQAPPPTAAGPNRNGCLIIGCGATLAGVIVLTVAVGFGIRWFYQQIEDERRNRNSLPTFSQMTDEDFQSQVAVGFRQKNVGVPAGTLRSIERFFREADRQRDAAAESPDVLRLIDGRRALQEIERSPNCVNLGRDDRKTLEEMPFAHNPFAKSGLPPRIVHVDLAKNRREAVVWSYSSDGVPMRWWLSRAAGGWKLFDTEDSETGRRETEEVAIKQSLFYMREAAWTYFVDLAAASDAVANSPYDAEAFRQMTAMEVTALDERVFDDGVMRVAFAYYYRRDYQRCLELCDLVKRPRIRPDVERLRSFCLQQLQRWEEAAESAERYERLLGPTPVVLAVRARAMTQLQRTEEAERAWKRVLAAAPADPDALAGWAESLPDDRLSELIEHLRPLPQFEWHAQQLVEHLCREDHEVAARTVVDWLVMAAPETRASLEAAGDLKNLEEDYQGAAGLYLAAHGKAVDDEDRSILLNAYLEAMAAAGRHVEAHSQAPNKRAILETFWTDFGDDDIYGLTRNQMTAIVAAHKLSDPDDPLLADIEANLLAEDGQDAAAEKILMAALAQAKQKPDADREESMRRTLVEVLLRQGKWKDALAQRSKGYDLEFLAGRLLSLGRLADARDLVEHLQREVPADASLPFCRALVLQAEKQYVQAWETLPPPVTAKASDEPPNWRLNQLITELVDKELSLLDRITERQPDGALWDALARELRGHDRWDAVARVAELWRKALPSDSKVLYWDALVQSHAKDRVAVTALLAQPLSDPSSIELPEYRRTELHWLLVESLLEQGRIEEAREHALRIHQLGANSEPLLWVLMKEDDVAAIEKVAGQTSGTGSWRSLPYHESRFRALLADDKYHSLRQRHPPSLEYTHSGDSAMLLFAPSDSRLLNVVQERLVRALPGANFRTLALTGSSPDIQTLEVRRGNERWLVHVGSKPYLSHEELTQFTTDSRPLRDAVAAHNSWIRIGRDDGQQAPTISTAALAAALEPRPGTALYLESGYRLARWDEALAKRIAASTRNADLSDIGEPCMLGQDAEEPTTLGRRGWREFLRAYRQRGVTSKPFRVQVEMTLDGARERLWFTVTQVADKPVSAQSVIGTAESDSLLYPTLKAGEPRHINRYRVLAVDTPEPAMEPAAR